MAASSHGEDLRLQDYPYQPLNTDKQEIRLVRLLPGSLNDPTQIEIFHVPLVGPLLGPELEISEEELRKTLPSCCHPVRWTTSRYTFKCKTHGNSERHPDPHFNQNSYSNLAPCPYADFQPKYEALSYVWGAGPNTENIAIRHSSASNQWKPLHKFTTLQKIARTFHKKSSEHLGPLFKLKIRPNLACALRHLRNPTDHRILWIDAICIDQGNKLERNDQVKRMSNIFKLAHCVQVWMDPAAEGTALAIRAFNKLGPEVDHIAHDDSKGPLPYSDPRVNLPFSSQEWTAIAQFCNQPWFSRLWVYQEIHLGNNTAQITCGTETTSWNFFKRVVMCIKDRRTVPAEFAQQEISTSLDLFLFEVLNSNFVTTLHDGRKLDCDDPRDHIYGLLSLAPDLLRSKFSVDYRQSKEEVFQRATLVSMQHYKRADILTSCFLDSKTQNMPSWVPSWDQSANIPHIFTAQFCAGFSRAEFTCEAPNMLHIIGKSCGTLVSTSERFTNDPVQMFHLFRQWQPDSTSEDLYVTGETQFDAFLACCVKGITRERFPNSMFTHYCVAQIMEGEPQLTDRWTISLLNQLYARKFIKTSEGHLGLGPPGARDGDVAAVILGCNAPIILRRQPAGTFQVVGECYIHGLSDATAFLGSIPSNWKVVASVRGTKLSYRFVHKHTGESTVHDPRLDSFDGDWEWVPRDYAKGDPDASEIFRNIATGETMNSDPRMSAENLRARGVALETFTLV